MMKGKLAASQLPKFSGDLHNQLMRRFQELKPDGEVHTETPQHLCVP